jgi:hypothetical protein
MALRFSVEEWREAILPDAVGFRRDVRGAVAGLDQTPQPVGVVAFVGLDQSPRGLCEQPFAGPAIGGLAACQKEQQGPAGGIGQGVDLGRPAAP